MSEAVKPIPRPKSVVQWVLVIMLAALVAMVTLPGYIGGQWPWSTPLPVADTTEIKSLLKAPLALPGWESSSHQEVRIGRRPWSLAEYQLASGGTDGPGSTFGLLMRPQMSADQQPEVEWVDMQGSQSWQINDRQVVRFSVPAEGQPVKITTQYFRALDGRNTFAVMQWYAWPTGGHYAPGKWFWADQRQQWQQRERMPWVAVSILLPIEPVGDIRGHTEQMTAIAETVQQSLLESALIIE
mgnify:FL=1